MVIHNPKVRSSTLLETVGPTAAWGQSPECKEPELTAGQATAAHQVASPSSLNATTTFEAKPSAAGRRIPATQLYTCLSLEQNS
jgi:hypothetical protein